MELQRGADTLVRHMLKVKEGENVLIYADTAADERTVKAVASAVYVAVGEPLIAVFETRREPDLPPPKALAAAMKNADIVVEFAKMYLIHTDAWRETLKAGVRVLCLTGMNSDILIRCIGRVNYPAMVELGEKLAQLTRSSKVMKVTSSLGTNLTFENTGRRIFHFTGVVEEPGIPNMLGGQVGWCPIEETINGTLVFDGSIWPPTEIGLLKTPVTMEVKQGKIVSISGGTEAQIISKWFAAQDDPNMYNLSHVCYGCNPGARLTGNILEDERVLGALEWGIGDQPEETGGKAGHATKHTDGIILKPSIWLDGELIEKEGEYVHPELKELARRAQGR
jgi:2,5-dihydroxypyridine 5,6-dioxygenase